MSPFRQDIFRRALAMQVRIDGGRSPSGEVIGRAVRSLKSAGLWPRRGGLRFDEVRPGDALSVLGRPREVRAVLEHGGRVFVSLSPSRGEPRSVSGEPHEVIR